MHGLHSSPPLSDLSRYRAAFTLIELAFILVLSGVIAGLALKLTDTSSTSKCYAITKVQLNAMRDAVERFAIKNDRFPMPARRNVGVESPSYGHEANPTNPAEIADLDSATNADGTVAVYGALPFQTLGILVENAADCWGNKLTYVVTKDLTIPKVGGANNPFLDNADGAIDIMTDNSVVFLKGAGYAILSHGADELGAVKNNYSGPDKKWCTAGSELRTQNCDVTNNVLISTEFNDGKNGAAKFFDDVIVYRGKPWRLGILVNGACGAADNTCTKGTPTGFTDPGTCGTQKTWQCVGGGGGTTANCSNWNAACGGGGGGGGGPTCSYSSCAGVPVEWGGDQWTGFGFIKKCKTIPDTCVTDQNLAASSFTANPGTATVSCSGGSWVVAPGATCPDGPPACTTNSSWAYACDNGTAINTSSGCAPSGQKKKFTWDCKTGVGTVSCTTLFNDTSCPEGPPVCGTMWLPYCDNGSLINYVKHCAGGPPTMTWDCKTSSGTTSCSSVTTCP